MKECDYVSSWVLNITGSSVKARNFVPPSEFWLHIPAACIGVGLITGSEQRWRTHGAWSTGVVSQQMDTSSIRFSSYTKRLHWRIGWSASVFLRVSRRFFHDAVSLSLEQPRVKHLNRPETRANKLQQPPTTQTTKGKELYTTHTGSRSEGIGRVWNARISQEFDMFLRC